jgi:hypothetical protein
MIVAFGSRLFISPGPGLARRFGRIWLAAQICSSNLLTKLLPEFVGPQRFPPHNNAARGSAISIESSVDVQYLASSHHG